MCVCVTCCVMLSNTPGATYILNHSVESIELSILVHLDILIQWNHHTLISHDLYHHRHTTQFAEWRQRPCDGSAFDHAAAGHWPHNVASGVKCTDMLEVHAMPEARLPHCLEQIPMISASAMQAHAYVVTWHTQHAPTGCLPDAEQGVQTY